MIEFVCHFPYFIIAVTAALYVQIPFRECFDLVLEFGNRSETSHYPEIQHDDKKKNNGKDNNSFERIFGFVLVFQKELKTVIVYENNSLQAEGIHGIFFIFPFLFECMFYLYDFFFVFDQEHILGFEIGFIYLPVLHIVVIDVMGDQSFMCFIALFEFCMVIFDGADKKYGKKKEGNGENKVYFTPQ